MTRPTAAPARWPYTEHRTIAEIDLDAAIARAWEREARKRRAAA